MTKAQTEMSKNSGLRDLLEESPSLKPDFPEVLEKAYQDESVLWGRIERGAISLYVS